MIATDINNNKNHNLEEKFPDESMITMNKNDVSMDVSIFNHVTNFYENNNLGSTVAINLNNANINNVKPPKPHTTESFTSSVSTTYLNENEKSSISRISNMNKNKKFDMPKQVPKKPTIPGLKLINIQDRVNKVFNFAPTSERLRKPFLYDFDLYIRAAKEIQRLWQGFKARKATYNFYRVRRVI